MVELVDTLDSKSGFCKEVGVRVPLQACLVSIDMSYIHHNREIRTKRSDFFILESYEVWYQKYGLSKSMTICI